MKKPIQFAAWCGVWVIIAAIFLAGIMTLLTELGIDPLVLNIFSLINSLLIYIPSIIFSYGFVLAGRKYKLNLLVIMSWLSLAMSAFMLVSMLASSFVGQDSLTTPDYSSDFEALFSSDISPFDLTPDQFYERYGMTLIEFLMPLVIMYALFSLIIGAFYIVYGISLLHLGRKISQARTAGILDIVAGATFIILIGWIVAFIAFIFEIITLFKASQKLER